MKKSYIAVVDFGAGNLHSVAKALETVRCPVLVTSEPDEILDADGIILPGVGASPSAMNSLNAKGLVKTLKHIAERGTPFLGVCLGLQLLMGRSEEGDVDCLDIVQGRVRKFVGVLKVPHMGWNEVVLLEDHPVFDGIPQGTYFYFVHSYYVDPDDNNVVLARTGYGVNFCSVLAKGNIIGTQFHPEKSADLGLKLYSNFASFALGRNM